MKSHSWMLWFFVLIFSSICAAHPTPQSSTSYVAFGQGVVVGFGTSGVVQGIQGLPFSADVVSETNRVLADGNRIHQETRGKIYRDSQGRTRSETEFVPPASGAAAIQHITIHDPVQQVFILLDPAHKTATVHHFPQRPKLDSPPPRTDVRLPRPEQRPAMSSEQLGTKEVEGLTVQGTRVTRTVAAGAMGNEKPMVSLHESWFSPDLKETILSVNDDPQYGQTSRKLVNIQRSEPDPALFQVPPDYRVKDDTPQD